MDKGAQSTLTEGTSEAFSGNPLKALRFKRKKQFINEVKTKDGRKVIGSFEVHTISRGPRKGQRFLINVEIRKKASSVDLILSPKLNPRFAS